MTKHTRMPMSDSAEDSNSDEPELTLDQGEARLEALEPRHERETRTARILSDGSMRDNEAADRDWMASKRDMAANMEAWLPGEVDHAAAQARQEAWDDRKASAADRKASAEDRSVLAEGENLDHR
jgi:hypothetical protein